ncbi:hypothetical protein BDZ89DRAFT_1085187 [Hymenopellis radicata]|nr:hypothetical protein BDZ89DRAFT_1085187 [Hymenopellis radicata]
MDSDLREILNRIKGTADSLGRELEVPHIVVLGPPSSGKSTVLECLVQREFLPRGPGITTRRPVVIRLVHSSRSEWSEFGHLEKRFTEYAEIQQEIQNETLRVAGRNKGISSQPIFLTLHSPSVVDLTLVDLPGLTTQCPASRPRNRLRAFAMEYISNYNTIVLVVSPVQADLCDSESRKLAQMVDPLCSRTLTVLTGVDNGVEIVDVLSGDVHVHRPSFRASQRGKSSARLAKAISAPLRNQFKDQLPALRTRANTLVLQTEREIESLGSVVCDQPHLQSALVLKMILQFSDDFVTSINGTRDEPVEHLIDADIRTAIRNSAGTKAGLFVPEVAFEMLMKPQIRMLEVPVTRCVDLVYDEMVQICHSCTSEELRRFPQVRTRLLQATLQLLRERLRPTQEFAQSLVDIEESYINTSHPELVARYNAARKAKDSHRRITAKKKSRAPKKSISSSTMRPTFVDAVPMQPPPRPHSALGTSSQADAAASAKDKLLRYFFKQSGGMSIPQPTTSTSLPSSPARQSFEDSPPPSQSDFTDNDVGTSPCDSPVIPSFPSAEVEPKMALIRSLIISYFDIVRESIQDLVPKVIMHSLVNRITAELQNHLIREVYAEKTDAMAAMLVEDESTARERERITAQLEVYRQAGVALTEISRCLV